MRQQRLTILTASLVAASVVAAGCSSSSGTSGGSSGGNPGTVQVNFWQQQFEDYQQKWFKDNVDKYNASQTKVHVNYLVVPADTWTQKLKAAQGAGTQPDVATTNYGGIRAGVANGQFAALDDLMPAAAFSDIKDNVKNFVTIKDKHYAYPMLVEPSTVLYYRTDLVKAAGLDPANPPKTWDDLLTWATKLTQGNVKLGAAVQRLRQTTDLERLVPGPGHGPLLHQAARALPDALPERADADPAQGRLCRCLTLRAG